MQEPETDAPNLFVLGFMCLGGFPDNDGDCNLLPELGLDAGIGGGCSMDKQDCCCDTGLDETEDGLKPRGVGNDESISSLIDSSHWLGIGTSCFLALAPRHRA